MSTLVSDSDSLNNNNTLAADVKTMQAKAIAWASQQGNTVNAEARSLATAAQNYASSPCGG